MTLDELKKIFIEFEKEYWVAPKGQDEQTRHIILHMTKLLGKIGGIAEKREHGFEVDTSIIKNEVIPDLLYYAFGLSDIYNVDLEKAFLERLEANKAKINGWKDKGMLEGQGK